ncbi:MAG: hypothetical protein B9S34_16635 [Opitutia bacterium Tous-C1TDCM]|nr:MAG: hypothetical protein B9S34_16635 [Opitutae bacterium Tous-C1TDCM]
MNRLPLILCAIAILGSVVSAGLFFQIGNSKQILELRLADATARAGKLETDLAQANEQNGALKGQVRALESDLGQIKVQFAAVETKAKQTEQDLAQTKNVLGVYELTARALADEISALRQDLAETRASNASPDAVAAYKDTIAELEKQLAAAKSGTAAPGTLASSTAVFTNRAGRATVLSVGPDSAFVVLNFGSVRGARLGHKLTVSQGTSEVAVVQISDVRPNFSIAQVLPDTLRGILQKGDPALLLR